MDVSEAKRLKALEEENAKLKKLLADQMLKAVALRELLERVVGPAVKREALRTFGPSWACRSVGPATSSRSTARHSVMSQNVRQIGHCAKSFANLPTRAVASVTRGCSSCCARKANARARTASTGSIARKALRCASAAPATARSERGRRSSSRRSQTRAGLWISCMTNSPAAPRRFRILNIVDDVTHEFLAALPDTSISSKRVARELSTLVQRRGKPDIIVSDHGLCSPRTPSCPGEQSRMEWHYIAPGKPMQNGFCENFNGCAMSS
jgi:putative transposase